MSSSKDIIIPSIRFKNAWLLRENTSKHLNELWGDGTPLRTHDEYEEIVEKYRQAWAPYEQKILIGMSETFGLTFRQPEIDVYIAPWFYAFSDPMVIGVMYEPNRFVEVLTHELLHRLISDNTIYHDSENLLSVWTGLFGGVHQQNTLMHIPVHAGLKAVFLDVLNEPRRLSNDIEKCSKWDDYQKAWEYVESNGYKEIIEKLKDNYDKVKLYEN